MEWNKYGYICSMCKMAGNGNLTKILMLHEMKQVVIYSSCVKWRVIWNLAYLTILSIKDHVRLYTQHVQNGGQQEIPHSFSYTIEINMSSSTLSTCKMVGNRKPHVACHTMYKETCMIIYSACAKWRVTGHHTHTLIQYRLKHVQLYTQYVQNGG